MVSSMKGRTVAENYFKNQNYPLIPKPVYNEIKNKLSRDQFRELKQYASDIEQVYLETYDSVSDLIQRNREFILNENEIKTQYKNAPRNLKFFKQLSENPEKLSINPAVKQKKIEDISNDTKWQIVYSNNTSNPIHQTPQPVVWKEILLIYENISPVMEDMDMDIYSKELDLLLTHNEFVNAIDKFITYYHVADMNSKEVLTKHKRFTVDQVMNVLKSNTNVQISQALKPSKKDDWIDWRSVKEVNDLYNKENKLTNDEDIVTPFD